MIGTWYCAEEDGFPHMHFLVPVAAEHAGISPAALSTVLYAAAATLTRYFARHEPDAPFMVVVDPEPHNVGSQFLGCVRLVPWPEVGDQYIEEHPACVVDFTDICRDHVATMNADPVFCTLLLPAGDEDEAPAAVNAPGSGTFN